MDSFLAQRVGSWTRLRQLAGKPRLDAGEVDELIGRYQLASADLVTLQTRAPDADLVGTLSATVAAGRAAVLAAPGRRRGWSALGHGITVAFPLEVYRAWRWWCATAAINIVVAFAIMVYVARHPERLSRALPSDAIRALVQHDFADYYSANPSQSFALQVWTNNVLVSALGLLLGITLIGTVYVLWQNIVNVGLVGGAMISAGKAGVFFGLIAPHGILELTAVFVATGSGLRLGWAWVAPGQRTRGHALAETGRRTVVIALGLVAVLAVSGAIEGFVTPSGLPTWIRIGIGVVAEIAFLAYAMVFGRRAALLGESADVSDDERTDVAPIS